MTNRGKQKIDEALLIALACGSTQENAAKTIGVSARTVQRRVADPEFQARLQDVKAELVGRTTGMLTASSIESVKMLMALQQANQPPTVRLGAARAIIELSVKLRMAHDVERRLAQVEVLLKGTPES